MNTVLYVLWIGSDFLVLGCVRTAAGEGYENGRRCYQELSLDRRKLNRVELGLHNIDILFLVPE